MAAVAIVAGSCSSGTATTDASVVSTTEVPATSTRPGTTADDASPGTTAGSAAGGDQAAVEAEVATLSAFVEQQRGLEFKEPVPVHLAEGQEFEDLLFATVTDEDWEDVADEGVVLEALGLVPPGTDMRAALTNLLGAGVLGFYDTETNELVIRGAELDLLTRNTMVHELTHALDDQHFELSRPELATATDESGFTFTAVAEGSARHVETAWQQTLTPEERKARERAELDQGMEQVDRLLQVPQIMLDTMIAPYTLGQRFVDDIVETDGQQALNDAFVTLPSTTEQIMDPDKYRAGETAKPVPAPTAEGEVLDEGIIGQHVTALLLGDEVPGRVARTAAEGWGGDRFVAWRSADGKACMAATWVMDTPDDGDELRTALDEWAAGTPADATVTVVDPSTVSIRSCAARAGATG